MSSAIDDSMIAWCKEQEAMMTDFAKRLETREMTTSETRPGIGRVDTTADTLAKVKASLDALRDLLARHAHES